MLGAGPGAWHEDPGLADRKAFLLRMDRSVLDALQRWANDDLRSLNGQIEFVLRHALRNAGREIPTSDDPATRRGPDTGNEPHEEH